MSIVFDIAVVVILALLIFLGYRKGFIRIAINLVGYLAAAVLAYFLSSPIAGWIFNTFMRNSSFEMIMDGLSKATEGQSVQIMLENALEVVPQNIRAFAPEGAVEEVTKQLTQSAPTHTEIANTIVDQLIGPIATTILQLLLFLILFVIFCIVVKLVTRMLKFVDKLPLIGGLNSALGLVAGLAEAVVFLLLFTSVVAIIIQLSGDQWSVVNQAVVDKTYIFKFLYEYNPLIQLK